MLTKGNILPTLGISPADLPAPYELGFSHKFQSWRKAQIHAIDQTIASKKRFVGIVAPCGFGKALYGMAVAKLMPGVERAGYLTSTRGLQDQAATDFATLDLKDIRGQQNYPCIALDPGSSLRHYRDRRKGFAGCNDGPCHAGVRCDHNADPRVPYMRPYCEYYGRVWDANRASLVNTNYAYWLTAGSYGQGLGDFDLLVLDEAHNAIEELERFLVFELNAEDTGRLAGNTRMPADCNPEKWREWGAMHARRLTDRLDLMDRTPPSTAEDAQERRKLKGLQSRLDLLRGIDPTQWIVEREQWRARFSPLDVRKYAETHLFRSTAKVILMSATLTAKTLETLGIAAEDAEILEFPSTFPVERRPVIALHTSPGVRISHRMDDSDQFNWLQRVDRIIETRRHLKGIIHTVSYARAKYLIEESEHKDLMLFHDSGSTMAAVEAFKSHIGGCVLVSPSIMTGFDFPGDECRYQIIGKVPLPDTRGPIMKARIAVDPDYPYYVAMQKLVQACGRGVRSEEDYCENIVIDDSFGGWFYDRAKKFAPKWFTESVTYVSSYPPVLSL